mgnify:FL=1
MKFNKAIVSQSVENTPQENSNVKRLVRNASNLFQKSGSLSTHSRIEMLAKATEHNVKLPKTEQPEKPAMPSKTRSMGMTVAKLVAAFSSGLTH